MHSLLLSEQKGDFFKLLCSNTTHINHVVTDSCTIWFLGRRTGLPLSPGNVLSGSEQPRSLLGQQVQVRAFSMESPHSTE